MTWPVILHGVELPSKARACLGLGWNHQDFVSFSRQAGCRDGLCSLGVRYSEFPSQCPEGFRTDVDTASLVSLSTELFPLTAPPGSMEEEVRFPVRAPRQIKPLGLTSTLVDYRLLCRSLPDLRRVQLLEAPSKERLYQYQRDGVKWLLERPKRILADDMGLGKTVQVIYALCDLFYSGAIREALVVCPVSLLSNWLAEFGKWAPELTCATVNPPSEIADEVWSLLRGKVHVMLTNYEQIRSLPASLLKGKLDIIVADEAHRIRKSETQLTKAFRRLRSSRMWAMTGTPIERDTSDLLNLLITVAPGQFSVEDGRSGPELVRAIARPYILRRLKTDVLADLPPVTERTEWLDLTGTQRAKYDDKYREFVACKNPDRTLALFGTLRQLCDADYESGESCKIRRIVDILSEVREVGEKAIVFSYTLEPLGLLGRAVYNKFKAKLTLQVDGSLPKSDRDKLVNRFKTDPNISALLLSTRIGAEGLNLTQANHVVFLNQWWNPSLNAQARDRVVRIGQTRPVTIWKLGCRRTLEESLERLLDSKTALFEEVVDKLAASDANYIQSLLGKS